MELIIGSLALIVALAALWLVTASMKKVEALGDTFMQRMRTDQKRITDELMSKITVLEKQNRKMAKQLSVLAPNKEEKN